MVDGWKGGSLAGWLKVLFGNSQLRNLVTKDVTAILSDYPWIFETNSIFLALPRPQWPFQTLKFPFSFPVYKLTAKAVSLYVQSLSSPFTSNIDMNRWHLFIFLLLSCCRFKCQGICWSTSTWTGSKVTWLYIPWSGLYLGQVWILWLQDHLRIKFCWQCYQQSRHVEVFQKTLCTSLQNFSPDYTIMAYFQQCLRKLNMITN